MLVLCVADWKRQRRWRGSGSKERHFVKLRLYEPTLHCAEVHVMC